MCLSQCYFLLHEGYMWHCHRIFPKIALTLGAYIQYDALQWCLKMLPAEESLLDYGTVVIYSFKIKHTTLKVCETFMKPTLWLILDNKASFARCRMTKPVCACHSDSMCEWKREKIWKRDIAAHQSEMCYSLDRLFRPSEGLRLYRTHTGSRVAEKKTKKTLESTFPNWRPSKLVPYHNRCGPDPSLHAVEPKKCHWIF